MQRSLDSRIASAREELDSVLWNASWIALSADPREDIGVFGFRCRLVLDETPAELKVRVSADQRYKLYVNGDMVCFGPQRGDETHWFYETIDLPPFLQVGENWIAALVWNFGRWAPMAQHTVRTGFVFDIAPPVNGSAVSEDVGGGGLSTPGDWEVARLPGWDFDMMHSGVGDFYIDVGPGEIQRSGPSATFDGVVGEPGRLLEWKTPHRISQAEERGDSGGGTPWMLVPRSIPLMRYELRSAPPLVRTPLNGTPFEPMTLKSGQSLLLDYGELLCAYPTVFVSCVGKATVSLTYAEALWNEDGKGNRNDVTDKDCRGYQDRIELEGWSQSFEPLWWRTYRYLKIEVDGDPVEIFGIDAIETGYPYTVESSFEADDPGVGPIWDVSVRTAQRCAGETYFDCPYYEQLQYVGDTRIQALIHYYLSRDRALPRNAVETLGWSLMENGLTQSRYPSRQTQVIPPFSLWWVMMVWDQLHYDDPAARPDFISFQTLNRVVGRFRKLQRSEAQYWQFGDWVPEWRWGVPPGGAASLMHQASLELAMEVVKRYKGFLEVGEAKQRDQKFWHEWSNLGRWGDRAGLTAGQREGSQSLGSEHAEALHILLEVMFDLQPARWPAEGLAAANAAKCTYYFSYYKHLAMAAGDRSEVSDPSDKSDKSDKSDTAPFDYLTELQPWKEMIESGLTTFAETPEPTRSD